MKVAIDRIKALSGNYNYEFYQGFDTGQYAPLATIESNTIAIISGHIHTSLLRPLMYVPAEYRLHLSRNIDRIKPAYDVGTAGYTPLEKISLLQVAGDYRNAGLLLQTLPQPESVAAFYAQLIQDFITRKPATVFRRHYPRFLELSLEALNTGEETLLLQGGIKLLSLCVNYLGDAVHSGLLSGMISERLRGQSNDERRLVCAALGQLRAIECFVQKGKKKETEDLMQEALALLDQIKSPGNVPAGFLAREARKRILYRYCVMGIAGKQKSRQLLEELSGLDPHSEEVNLLVMEHPQFGPARKIAAYHTRTILHSIAHHKFSKLAAAIESHEGGTGELAFNSFVNQASFVVKDVRGYLDEQKHPQLQGTKMMHQAAALDRPEGMSMREYLFGNFFLEERRTELTGNFALNPILALQAFREERSNLYESNYLQRNVGFGFRDELMSYLNKDGRHARKTDPVLPRIRELEASVTDDNLHLYLRVLASLGLHLVAMKKYPFEKLKRRFPDYGNLQALQAWSVMGYIYMRCRPYDPRTQKELSTTVDETIAAQPVTSENVRIVFISLIRLIIYYAKDVRQPSFLPPLIARCDELLEKITGHPHMSDHEKQLLCSRYYRAKAFMFQFSGDRNSLLKTMALCESHADACMAIADREGDEKLRVLANDNWMGCYESFSRTYEFLHAGPEAISYMKKIIDQVDRRESKAWMQLGEIYYKAADFEQARDCFLQALSLGPPLYATAWYWLGHCYQEMGNRLLHYHCLSECFRYVPHSSELAATLHNLSKKFRDKPIELISANFLSAFNDH